MSPVIVVERGSRSCLSADEFLAELDKGSTLLFIKENRPAVSISRAVSAPQFIEPSVPVLQEEALGEPSSPHQDAEASVRSGVITPPPPESTAAEEACPEEKAMDEDEDFEEGGSKSSSHHELSSVSGTRYDTSSLTKGSSSVLDDCSDVEPLSIQPAPFLPWVGRVVPRAEMKPAAPVKEGFPQWSDLWFTVEPKASREESTPPPTNPAGTHQENIKDTETKDLKARAETLVFDLVRFSGCGYVSAEFRFKVGQSLVSFALTSEEACSLVRNTLDREMLRLRKEEEWPQKLIHLHRFIKRFPMIFVGMKCQLPSWVLEDLDEDEPVEVIPPPAPADPPAEGLLIPAPEPPPGLLFFPAPQPPAKALPLPPPAPAPQPPAGVLSSPPPAPSDPQAEGLLVPAPEPPPEGLLVPAPEPPPGLLFFSPPALQPPAVVLSSPPPAPAPQPPAGVLSFLPPAPAPQPPAGVLSSPPPVPAPQPPAGVLSSPPPAPAPQPPAGVLFSPPPVPAPQPPAGVLFSPPPAPAPQPPAAVAPPQPQAPPSSQQNNTDAVEDMEVEDGSSSQPSPPDGLATPVAPPQPPPSSSQQNTADAVEGMEVDGSSSQPSPPDGLATPVAPPQPPPPSSLQNITDALKDMKVEDSSFSQLPPPQDQTPHLAPPSLPPSRKRRAPSPLQQNNGVRDEVEPTPKKAKLCLTASDLKAQPSSPSGLSAAFAPPQPQTPPSSQLLPPQDQTPPSLPPARKRRAPSPLQQNNGVRDEVEPKQKRARLFGPLDEVTPPQAQTSSQQNKADAGEVDSSSVSHQPIQQVPPPVSPPQRRCLKRSAPCTAQELSEDMVSPSKKQDLTD